jgi:hypothetical protein
MEESSKRNEIVGICRNRVRVSRRLCRQLLKEHRVWLRQVEGFRLGLPPSQISGGPVGLRSCCRRGRRVARSRFVRQPGFCPHRLQGLFTRRVPILPRASCGEEYPD